MTERKPDTPGAHASADALRAIFENLHDAVYLVDAEGVVVDANPAACRQLGYARDELIGMHVSRVSARGDFDFAATRRALDAEGFQRFQSVHRHRDGSEVPVELVLTRVTVDGAWRIAGIARDMTEQRRAEAARRRLEEQLAEAGKLDAIGRLAGGVAHDFNNLLTAISSYAELALEDLPAGASARADLQEIQKATRRAAGLTAQLLAFSRRQVVEPRVVDLNELVGGSVKMLQRLIGEDVQLTWAPGAGVGPVRVDPGQLEQVLVNLAVNARDAMPRGGKLRIETHDAAVEAGVPAPVHADARPGRHARLRVVDTGAGMTPEVLRHVFEPFFTTKPKGAGTGLGLSISYGIVRQAGGFILVDSAPGKGTAFDLWLPVADGAPAAARGADADVPTGNEVILVVEDEPAVLEVAARFLRRQGFEVLPARGPEDALRLAALRQGPIDLLLTDVVMPVLTGPALHDALAASRPGLRVVYMSGYTDDAIARHGVLGAGVHLVQKPFTLAALVRTVREVLDGPPPGRRP